MSEGWSVCLWKKSNSKFQLAVCEKYAGNQWKTLIYKLFRLSYIYTKSKIPWTTHASNLVGLRSNYTWSLYIRVSCTFFYMIYSPIRYSLWSKFHFDWQYTPLNAGIYLVVDLTMGEWKFHL